MEHIFSTENVRRIVHQIKIYDEKERFFIFKNLFLRDQLDEQILDLMLTDKSFIFRLLALRKINFTERPDILKRLLKDKNQKIRRDAINRLSKVDSVAYQSEIEELLFDHSSSIRAKSRILLAEIKELDYPERYRQEMKENPSSGSIIGLSEVGDISDRTSFMNLLKSDRSKHRAAALYALSKVDYPHAKEKSFELLQDSSNTVKKTCVSIITKEKSIEDLVVLRKNYDLGSTDSKRYI